MNSLSTHKTPTTFVVEKQSEKQRRLFKHRNKKDKSDVNIGIVRKKSRDCIFNVIFSVYFLSLKDMVRDFFLIS